MKWFTTTNQASLDSLSFFRQLQVAVISARRNTALEPFLVYDGNEHENLGWLRAHGVTILPHALPYRHELSEHMYRTCPPDLLPQGVHARSGAHLKSEVPAVVREYGMADRFVLYTDCDVIFMREPALERMAPRRLAAWGERHGGRTRWRLGGWMHFNSGVILMNVGAMHADLSDLRTFILTNGGDARRPPSAFMQKNLFMSDQVALNLFYAKRIARLDESYNWHPTRGLARHARIIHFNGLKWTDWEEFRAGEMVPRRMAKFSRIIGNHVDAFEEFVVMAREYLAEATVGAG